MDPAAFNHHDCLLSLNPVSQWIRLSEQSDARHGAPWSGSVLYFLSRGDVYGLRMNLEGQVLINELADYQPCTVAQWARLSSLANADQLDRLVGQLAEMGLVAWNRQ